MLGRGRRLDDPHPNQSNKKAPLCKGSYRTNVRLRDCFDCFGLLQSLRHGKPCHLPLHKGGFDFIILVGRCLARNPQSSTSLASGNPTRCRRLFFRVVVGADPYRLVWVFAMLVGRCLGAAVCFADRRGRRSLQACLKFIVFLLDDYFMSTAKQTNSTIHCRDWRPRQSVLSTE